MWGVRESPPKPTLFPDASANNTIQKNTVHPLEQYLTHLAAIRNTGAATPETSFYPPLAELLNAVGHTLKPKVRAVNQLANTGAGIPDGGLFSETQFKKRGDAEPLPGQMPERGVIEIKSPKEEVAAIADTKQVSKYWQKYRLVLVTNYRDFLVVGERDGKPVALESYRLAESEAAFWALATHPRKAATEQGERFADFLARCLRANAPLSDPKDVAWFLASYARDARTRIEHADMPALASIRASLEESLGLKFEGEKGEHFFRSTLVQTLFYGVFAGWVLWHRDGAKGKFDWKLAAWHLHVPMIRALYEQLAQASQVRRLGLEESLDLAADVLNRINRGEFFKRFEDHHAVQYFYEPFLEAFDPELRKQLGVWYTPTEIVRYMVARVDQALQTELGLADGLADPNVVVLDPCCGTGAYLVEVLRVIGEKQKANGEDALAAHELKRAMTERIFGFELLPAPFVIAHLQIGLLLSDAGAPLAEDERAGVYLTNALTGWEPPKTPKNKVLFPELDAERDLADHVKRDKPILVIIGNPPYNGYAGLAVDEERDLSNAYRTVVKVSKPQGQGLNDLYVRFFRMAERRIVEQSAQGVVCFISNYSWLDGLSFTGMRERFLDVYDKIWIDNLHGDRIISEYAPDGRTSETVFAMQGSSPGIKVGTAIATFVRTKKQQSQNVLNYRDFDQARAEERRAALVQSVEEPSTIVLSPDVRLGFPFKPRVVGTDYHAWPKLPDVFPIAFPGVQSKRDEFVIDIDKSVLRNRMNSYFDPSVSNDAMKAIAPRAMEVTNENFSAIKTRQTLQARGLKPEWITRFAFRPFDLRWIYYEHETNLLQRRVPQFAQNVFDGNCWIVSQQIPRRDWSPPQLIFHLGCLDLMDRSASCFPMYRQSSNGQMSLGVGGGDTHELNLSEDAIKHARNLKCDPESVFLHAVAIQHSPAYAIENAGALCQDWPRIPLPATRELLEASAALGTQLAALMDVDAPVAGVTSGAVRGELKNVAVISRVDGGSLNPDKGELALTAGWGHGGKGGVTMPGKGTIVVRAVAGDSTTAPPSQPSPGAGAGADRRVVDVYLNGVAYWKNIPEPVWEFTLGGYQVMKKWLSYRERSLLGRDLTIDEAKYFTEMARRIAAILALAPALDNNYRAVKANTYAWPR